MNKKHHKLYYHQHPKNFYISEKWRFLLSDKKLRFM
jgi:hypothetical protein